MILEQGYGGVSMEAVARTAGVTRPVVYDHFPNLGRLLYSLIEREEQYAIEQLEQIVPDDPGELDPTAAVRRRRPTVPRGGCRSPRDLADHPAAARRHAGGRPRPRRDEPRANTKRIEHLVGVAVERADLPKELDVELVARAIRCLGEEAGRTLLTDPERYSPERYAEFVTSLMALVWPPKPQSN